MVELFDFVPKNSQILSKVRVISLIDLQVR